MLTNNQFSIPEDHKKIKERIRRYERAMEKEENEKGFIEDMVKDIY